MARSRLGAHRQACLDHILETRPRSTQPSPRKHSHRQLTVGMRIGSGVKHMSAILSVTMSTVRQYF